MNTLLFVFGLLGLSALAQAQCPPTCPRDCKDIYDQGGVVDGQYVVYIAPANDPINVFCDQNTDGGGWTLMSRRINANTDFNQPYNNYKIGFGQLGNNFWIGLDDFRRFSQQKHYKLRIDMTSCSGTTAFSEYGIIRVYTEADGYAMNFNTYIGGTAGDSLSSNRVLRFTARDRDNDMNAASNCAVVHGGGWWHNNCTLSNLNGVFNADCASTAVTNIFWHSFTQYSPLRNVQIKIKPM